MDRKLFCDAVVKYLGGLLLMGILLFVPAGTLVWPRGWLLMGILFLPMLAAGVVMMLKSPDLLRKRLRMKEEQGAQKRAILASGVMFVCAFIAAGLSFRFGFLQLPEWVSWVAAFLFLAGYALFAEVLRENAWLSRTVEVQKGQRVIDTGLYGIVRHPMYMSTLALFLSMPLVLGSVLAFAVTLFYIPIIAGRIRGEEEILEKELEGYREYKKKVRYRIIPFIW